MATNPKDPLEKGKTGRLELRIDEDTLLRIDNWRSRENRIPSRAEAIRQLVRK